MLLLRLVVYVFMAKMNEKIDFLYIVASTLKRYIILSLFGVNLSWFIVSLNLFAANKNILKLATYLPKLLRTEISGGFFVGGL